MKRFYYLISLSLFLGVITQLLIAGTNAKELSSKYKKWLDVVSYIITPTEKEVFLKLRNNRERDAFINLFWNMRDPSKGTPQNEFKEEHLRRFQYVNQYFKYEGKPGWKTERGRIYIILGPPVSRNEINVNGLRPMEIWEYYGGPQKGLPPVFRIVFYKPSPGEDYRLYIPAVDGPATLLTTPIGEVALNPISFTDYYEIYCKIQEIEPEAAEVALSLIPGEAFKDFRPSLRDANLISKIYELPKKGINVTYAKNFLNYKGIVEVNVTTNYIDNKSELYILKNPFLDLNFVHLAIEPERLSVEYLPEKDQYYCHFKLTINLRKKDHIILQYDKDFPLYFTKEELKSNMNQGLIITDFFPVIEGEYDLRVILRNSVNDEISFLEKTIKIMDKENFPTLYEPILSYSISSNPISGYSPFNILGYNIKTDPKQIFGLNDSINVFFCVRKASYGQKTHLVIEVENQGGRAQKPYFKRYFLLVPSNKKLWFTSQNLGNLPYGNYILRAKLKNEEDVIFDAKEIHFQVSTFPNVPHPPIISKILKSKDRFIFFFIIATQYQKTGQFSKAEHYYEKALALNNSYSPLIKMYANFLLQRKKYDKALAVIENLKNKEKEAFTYYSLKGRALYYKKNYYSAIDSLFKANEIYDSDIVVLNTLGLAFLKIGEKEEAFKVLSASLKINKNQKNIENILLQLKEELGK